MKTSGRFLAFLLSFCMIFSLISGLNVIHVKAEIPSDVNIAVEKPASPDLKIWYRTGTGPSDAWQDGTSGITFPTSCTVLELIIGSEEAKQYDVSLFDGEGREVQKAIMSQIDYYSTTPTTTGGQDIYSSRLVSDGDHNFKIKIEANNGGGGSPDPSGGSAMDSDFRVKVGSTTIFDNSLDAESKTAGTYTSANGKEYTVEIDSRNEGIIIKPKQGTDTLARTNPDATLDARVAAGSSLVLDTISTHGSGKVEIDTGLNYTPDDMQSGHVEEVVPVTIKKATVGGTGNEYSFYSESQDADLCVSWGNKLSTATFEGEIFARSFSISDNAKLIIGSEENSPNHGLQIKGNIILAKANTKIYGKRPFFGSNETKISIEDEANVSVVSSASDPFYGCKEVKVQTGGKIYAETTSGQQLTLADGFEVKAGYYTEIGEILELERVGRYQDSAKEVHCVVGDHKNEAGRYIYSKNSKSFQLESTTKTLHSMAFSFDPSSGDKYVEKGNFKIEAASGLQDITVQNGGEYFFEEGTEVKFTLLPDPGCKYVEGTFSYNDMPSEDSVTPTETPGVYTITMPDTAIHVSCKFEEANNDVLTDGSNAIVGAQISVPDGVVSNGTATFEVLDATLDSAKKEAFNDAATAGYTVSKALDLSFNQEIDKIGTNDKWVTPINNLSSPMTVTMILDDSLLGASDIEIIRQHNGRTEALETSYDASTNQVTFKTDGFSTYAIATKTNSNSEEQTKNFVNRLYDVILGRTPDGEGQEYWSNQLLEKKRDAASVVSDFYTSAEYKASNKTDEQYVTDLYQSVMGREADAEGKAYWVGVLKNSTREEVLAQFIASEEFTNICDNYGIVRGTLDTKGKSYYNSKVRDFVLRIYDKVLGRSGDTAGIEYWTYEINKGVLSPYDVVSQFMNSEEMKGRNLNDEAYVELLYQTFMNRASDPEGKAYWLNELNSGVSRDDIINHFAASKEFIGIISNLE